MRDSLGWQVTGRWRTVVTKEDEINSRKSLGRYKRGILHFYSVACSISLFRWNRGGGEEGRATRDDEINCALLPSAADPVWPIVGHLVFCNLRFCWRNATLLDGCRCVPCWPVRPSCKMSIDKAKVEWNDKRRRKISISSLKI